MILKFRMAKSGFNVLGGEGIAKSLPVTKHQLRTWVHF